MSKVRSALGNVVDFEMMSIMNSLNGPKPTKTRVAEPEIVSSMTTEQVALGITTKEGLTEAIKAAKEVPLVITEPETDKKRGK